MKMAEKKEMSFEEKLNRLNEIVGKIEGETLPLQETLALYKEGKTLIVELQKELSDAEKKVGDLSVSDEDVK